jgi:hypothetical protein
MEHRWGQRIDVAIPVRLYASTHAGENDGQLANLSLTGGWIDVHIEVRRFSTMQLLFELPEPSMIGPHLVNAYVARQTEDGIGLEWCEYAPRAVVHLIRAMIRREHPRDSRDMTTMRDRTGAGSSGGASR